MYETKKENALKTLEKKQGKVDEIEKVRTPSRCSNSVEIMPAEGAVRL